MQRGRVESYSTPVVWRDGAHDQLVLHRAGIIEGYQVSTGKPLWSLPANTSGASTPIAAGELIYAATWNVLGEDDQRASLPDFAAMLKLYDKNGDRAIGDAEFPPICVSPRGRAWRTFPIRRTTWPSGPWTGTATAWFRNRNGEALKGT